MQVSRIIALPKSEMLLGSRLWLIARLSVVVLIGLLLFKAFQANQNLLTNLSAIKLQWKSESVLLMITVVTLLPLNWLLEAKKWQIIAQKEKIRLFRALKGVLMGLSLDSVLPFGTGAVGGRISTIARNRKIKMIPGILAGQFMQTAVTLMFGLIATSMLYTVASEKFIFDLNIYHFLGLGVLPLPLFFFRKRVIVFLRPLKCYSFNAWLNIFSISIARYLVFLTQFLLLIYLLNPEITFILAFGCGSWVFAARTFMPKVSNLENLGIRALAVIFFADVFSLDPSGLLVAVGLLWLINLALPSLVGLFYLLKHSEG